MSILTSADAPPEEFTHGHARHLCPSDRQVACRSFGPDRWSLMRFFVARSETSRLGPGERAGRRGDFAQLSDGITHYEISGPPGPLLVLIPGLTVSLDIWDSLLPGFHDQGLRTLTYSAFGRGYSDRVLVDYDRELFVRQLDELLRAVDDAGEVHLVGSSMGALIALGYVRRRPGTVASLTLSGPAGLDRRPNLNSRIPKRGPIGPLIGKYVVRANLLRHIAHNVRTDEDAELLRASIIDGFRFEGSAHALLSTVTSMPLARQDALFDASTTALPPTMLLWGTDDRVTPADRYAEAVRLLDPDVTRLFRDCGHMVPYDRPDEFTEMVGAFAVEHSARALAT